MRAEVVAKIDVGMIALEVTADDREKIGNLINSFGVMPNIKMSIYKNRRGAYNRIFLWMYADKGTCRYETLFATDFNFNPVPLKECDLLTKFPNEFDTPQEQEVEKKSEEKVETVDESVELPWSGDDFEF